MEEQEEEQLFNNEDYDEEEEEKKNNIEDSSFTRDARKPLVLEQKQQQAPSPNIMRPKTPHQPDNLNINTTPQYPRIINDSPIDNSPEPFIRRSSNREAVNIRGSKCLNFIVFFN